MEIRFLTLSQVLEIHQASIERYGGSLGVRDMGLLESAIAQPRASFAGEFLHEFPQGMAAAYLFHLVMNHPFVDGNKRTGALAAFAFLEFNSFELDAPEDAYEAITLAVARGEAEKDEVVAFFRKHLKTSS